MSKTLYVEFRGQGFWAFDVLSAVFLKHLVDAAAPRVDLPSNQWLSDAIRQWRFNALVSDCGFFLDEGWTADQIRTVADVAAEACATLSKRAEIPAEEITSWEMLDDLRVFPRGLPFVTTASASRLGRAVINLLNGCLPESPPGTW
jgi:hypothetical protein